MNGQTKAGSSDSMEGVRVGVIGAGAWGTALACVAARGDNNTLIWGRDGEVLDDIQTHQKNRKYLGDIALHPGIGISESLEDLMQVSDVVLLVTPAQTITAMAGRLSELARSGTTIINCAKGIDRDTGQLPHETLRAAIPHCEIAALSGPSFAVDVARDLPTAVTLASSELSSANRLAEIISTAKFRCYAQNDLLGVELGGALKNVLALAVGACRGMGLGASAEAALIARGFAEISRLAGALGANPQTLMGLAGLGDLVLTCSSEQSRNFAHGMKLGAGHSVSGMKLAEGAFTAGVAVELSKARDVETPVIDAVSKLVDQRISAEQAMKILLERPLKQEN